MNYLVLLLTGLVASMLLTWGVKEYAVKNELLDIPNERSSHKISTPRGGGLAIVVVFLAATVILFGRGSIAQNLFLCMFLSGLVIAVVGFWDDHGSVSRKLRIAVHFFAAMIVFQVIGGLEPVPILGGELDLGMVGNLIGIVALVWLLNLYNFMDGIDGIATIEAVSVAGSAALLLYLNGSVTYSLWLAFLVATCGGFLYWNWPPAKIFMGDVGSSFLGIVLGAFALITSNDSVLTVWTWLILLGVFLVDATVTLLTRGLRGLQWYEAHRNHAYQHAAIRLKSHKTVTLAVLCINVFWLYPWAWLSVDQPNLGVVFTVVAYAPLIITAFYLGAGKEEYLLKYAAD